MRKKVGTFILILLFLITLVGEAITSQNFENMSRKQNFENRDLPTNLRLGEYPYNISAKIIPNLIPEKNILIEKISSSLHEADSVVIRSIVLLKDNSFVFVCINSSIIYVKHLFPNGTIHNFIVNHLAQNSSYSFISSYYNSYSHIYAAVVKNSTTAIVIKVDLLNQVYATNNLNLSEFINERLTNVGVSPNGEIYIGGSHESTLQHDFEGITDALIIKFDTSLKRTWHLSIDGGQNTSSSYYSDLLDTVIDLEFNRNNSNILFVLTQNDQPSNGYNEFSLIKIDSNGTIIAAQKYKDGINNNYLDDFIDDYPKKLIINNDKLYVLVNRADGQSKNLYKVHLLTAFLNLTIAYRTTISKGNNTSYYLKDAIFIDNKTILFLTNSLFLYFFNVEKNAIIYYGNLPEIQNISFSHFVGSKKNNFILVSNYPINNSYGFLSHYFAIIHLPSIPHFIPESINVTQELELSFSWNESLSQYNVIIGYELLSNKNGNITINNIGNSTHVSLNVEVGWNNFQLRSIDNKTNYSPWSEILHIEVSKNPFYTTITTTTNTTSGTNISTNSTTSGTNISTNSTTSFTTSLNSTEKTISSQHERSNFTANKYTTPQIPLSFEFFIFSFSLVLITLIKKKT